MTFLKGGVGIVATNPGWILLKKCDIKQVRKYMYTMYAYCWPGLVHNQLQTSSNVIIQVPTNLTLFTTT